MNKKGQLNRLIQSLTKSEKRHFRISTQNDRNKNYFRLFEFILQNPECTDQVIKTHFRGEAFTRQLHVTKNYLNQMILKRLHGYHAKLSMGIQLRTLLSEIEILFMKALYDPCEALIEKGLALCEKYEKHIESLSFYQWKRRLHFERASGDGHHRSVKAMLEQENMTLKKWKR